MSGSSRRRHSKWDHRDSEALSENFSEKDAPWKTREPPSPTRGSRRHKSHRSERSDREDDNIRPSPDRDEWRYQHPSQSPRNGRGRSYRSRSRSRSQSRSRSPTYNYRREPALSERSRGTSGGSATICRDFIAGRCRRGTHCFFLHQDAELSDSRRPLGRSPPDSREKKDRRIGGSRYLADDSKEYSVRGENPGNLCDDFLKGRCRRGSSCRFAHHERSMTDAFEKGPADDVYRDRDNNRQIQGNYPDRNRDLETYRRVVTPCKFFAVGNCRNGNHCKFSHQVQENVSPERLSRDDRRGSDCKLDRSPASDEPRWSDAIRVSNVPTVHDWEEDKETLAVNSLKPGNDSWDCGRVKIKQTWDAPSGIDEPKIGEGQTLRWKTENIGASIRMDNISGDTEISPRDVSNQHSSSLYSETPSLSNISFPTVQLDTSETPNDNHHHRDFPEPKVSGDLYAEQNPNFEDELNIYAEEGKNNVGSDRMCITSNPPMNVQPLQNMFQNDPPVNVRPTLSINPPPGQLQLPLHPGGGDTLLLSPLNPLVNAPVGRGISPGDPRVKLRPTISMTPSAGQGQPLLPLHSSGGNGMQTSHDHSSHFDNNNKGADGPPGDQSVDFQPLSSIDPSAARGQLPLPLHSPGGNGMQTSHNPTAFLNNKAADGPHLNIANMMQPVPNHSSVSNEQLAQLSHLSLSLSLAQLLERQQQLNLSSASNPSAISSVPDTAPSIQSVSNATIQPSQASEAVKQYDPKSGNQMLPNIAEQKSSGDELCLENNQQEPCKMFKDGENGGEIVEGGSKAPENKLAENIAADDGDEDGKKSKDSKGLRSFKFALADYTKELLKPAWKDGKVNKETYKTIAKKVVDKVIETQGPQIPQTKEKIDQYLSCSKTKLEKLVQAYVGKYKT